MAGYKRYVFPIMPLSACFFVLLIYEAIVVWRRPASFSAESALIIAWGIAPGFRREMK
jgi:hypothetical protein